MKKIICESCGGGEFREEGGYRICQFCKSRFQIQKESQTQKESVISLDDDIQRLLKLCKENPAKAPKYAGLILDIDPTNREAMEYIRR